MTEITPMITPKQSGLISDLISEIKAATWLDWVDYIDDRTLGIYLNWEPGDGIDITRAQASELIEALKQAKQEMGI